MKTLATFFVENSKLTIVLSFFLIIYGALGIMKMNAESFPSVSFATAIITTAYDGASADDIETKITKPIEDEIRGVSGLKDVRSTSQAGLSTIVVRIDMDNVDDVDEVMSDVQKAVDRVSSLPNDLKDAPSFKEVKVEEMPVFQIAITGDNQGRFRDRTADELKEELEDNNNVKGVTLQGFAKRVFQIRLDNDALKRHHIGIDEAIAKIKSRNVNIPGGNLKAGQFQQLLRIEGKIKNAEDLQNTLIRSNFNGQQVLLKDIALVEDSEEDIPVKTHYNGEDATLLTVSKKAGADTIELVDGVMRKLDEFKKINHGKIGFHIFQNESIKVKNKLEVLSFNALSGLFLVVIFLFIFLPGRIGILASLSLPLAVMGTVGLMPTLGMNLNSITILALVIALGMLVDNSVVISENFTRLRQEGMKAKEAALDSVRTLWLPITATALTTIAAFLPMLVTKGIMGQFIKYIPIIVSISLLLSLAESFFFLPMRLALFGGKVKQLAINEHKDWFHRFEIKFETLMNWCVTHRYLVTGLFTGILVLSFVFIRLNNFILFPADQTEIYISRFQTEKGTKVEITNQSSIKLAKKIKEILGEDAKHLVARAGSSMTDRTDPKAEEGNNVGIIFIYVSDEAKFTRSDTDVLEALREIHPSDFGLKSLSFEAQINGPPVGDAIDASFRSNNMDNLNGMIKEIISRLSGIKGILDLKVNDVIGDDEIYVKVDYEKIDQLGLNVNLIGNSIRSAVSGKVVSNVTLNNKETDLIVRLKEIQRQDIPALKEIKIMDRLGNLVPLETLAQFEKRSGSPQIKRFDFKRAKTILGSVDEVNITSVAANLELKKIFNELKSTYPNVSLTFGGAAQSTKESMESLASAGMLAAIGIFAILVFIFGSYLRPLIIMLTIPLGFLGFSVAFYLPILSGYPDRSRPISFLALIGIIGLAGIIVNSGIVLISFIDQMRKEGKLGLHEILVKSSGMRLRAVLVTSLTTISGLIPTAYGIGGTDAILVPMTMALAWGLTSGTVLTLIFIPCAYAILEDFTLLVGRVFKKKEDPALARMTAPFETK